MAVTPTSSERRWTARELRALSADERNAILQAAATRAERDYREDAALTEFQALGKDDLHVDSSNAETR